MAKSQMKIMQAKMKRNFVDDDPRIGCQHHWLQPSLAFRRQVGPVNASTRVMGGRSNVVAVGTYA